MNQEIDLGDTPKYPVVVARYRDLAIADPRAVAANRNVRFRRLKKTAKTLGLLTEWWGYGSV